MAGDLGSELDRRRDQCYWAAALASAAGGVVVHWRLTTLGLLAALLTALLTLLTCPTLLTLLTALLTLLTLLTLLAAC